MKPTDFIEYEYVFGFLSVISVGKKITSVSFDSLMYVLKK